MDASDRVEEFYVELLFFHVEQLRYVVVELKIRSFKPAQLGQLGSYVAIVDDYFRRTQIHAPTIGVLLCKADGPLRAGKHQRAGRRRGLPRPAAGGRGVLPTADELEAVIGDGLDHQLGRAPS